MKRAAALPTVLLLALCAFAAGCRPTPTDPDAALRTELAAHREQQLQRLHAYAVAGEFPHNVTVPTDLHMFRDADGRYCAVANLVHRDGHDDLVEETVRNRNDLAVSDVHDGAMMKWVLESGLTQEELVRIQLPAMPLHVVNIPAAKPIKKKPTPVDAIANVAPPPAPVFDEEALKTQVRAHLAEVESELRAHADESIRLAVTRAHASGPVTRVASR